MKRATLLLTAILLGGCAHSLRNEDYLMKSIESSVSLPKEAAPLRRYRRHYAWVKDDYDAVMAVYALGGQPKRLWLPNDEMPIVLDGGCSVVTFRYHLKTKLISELTCN
jgi:hypothetical protein